MELSSRRWRPGTLSSRIEKDSDPRADGASRAARRGDMNGARAALLAPAAMRVAPPLAPRFATARTTLKNCRQKLFLCSSSICFEFTCPPLLCSSQTLLPLGDCPKRRAQILALQGMERRASVKVSESAAARGAAIASREHPNRTDIAVPWVSCHL